MNRSKKRHQKKLARKAAKKNRAQAPAAPATKAGGTSSQNFSHLVEQGIALQQSGQLDEAEVIYRNILERNPSHADAHHLLGVLTYLRGNPDSAVSHFRQALAVLPDFAEVHVNLGNALQTQGRIEEAVASFQKAISINPKIAEAHNNLGNALKSQGLLEDALNSYRQALAINPDYANAHNNLGNALQGLNRCEEAVENFNRAIALNPNLAEAHSNLGNALQELNRKQEAVTSYHKALALKPDYAEAHSNLGNALLDLGRMEDAVACQQKALAINPDYAEGHYNLANTLESLGNHEAAAASFNKAIALNPDFPGAYNNLANTLNKLGRLEDSVANYEKALALDPAYADANNNLGGALQDLGRLQEARAHYNKSLDLEPGHPGAIRNLLFLLLNLPGLSPDELFAENMRLSESLSRGIAPSAEPFNNIPDQDRRLRVGYLSSDFRDHAVAKVVLPLFTGHDRENFEIYCYADVPRPDAITERFRSRADQWRPIGGKTDEEVAKMVRADSIDILVCMAGRFDRNRPLVCAHRAAPVQVSFHDGATSGLKEMDYWLTDGFLHPPDTREGFTEELFRLPVFYQWLPIEEAPEVGPLPAAGTGAVTFASFNNPAKLNDRVIGLWAEILQFVPGSRLMLKYKNWYRQTSLKDRLTAQFAKGGVAPERLIFVAKIDSIAEHLAHYAEVDIALDPFPFNGSTTTFQALWMGVPVITLAGETFISRAGGSFLHHAGLGDLAAETPENYVQAACDLADDIPRLNDLRAGMRERLSSSPLCDAPAFANSIETAFRTMWRTWCKDNN